MPSGLLSLLIPICLLVLLASGWRRETIGDVPLVAALVVLFAPVLAGFPLQAGADLSFSADQAIYAAALCAALLTGGPGGRQPMALLLALLLGILYNLPYAMLSHMPCRLGFREWGLPLVAGLFAALFLQRPQEQFATLWLGLAMAAWWRQQWSETVQLYVGGRGFADALWLSYAGARLITELVRLAGGGASRLLSRYK